MPTKTKKAPTPKPKTPKPHPMAFIGAAPCDICGCEWFRPTIAFTDENGEALEFAKEGAACANPWHNMVAILREQIRLLRAQRKLLARLAAKTPQFSNPVEALEAEALRDKVLSDA